MINTELCKQCKLCIEVCPCKIIGLNESGNTCFLPEREHLCLKCGQCMAICNSEAVAISDLVYGKDIVKLPENKTDYTDLINFLMHRRSVRNYKKQPVSNEDIKKVIESISYAPFGSAPNKMHVTVINNREKIETTLPHIEAFLDKIVKLIESPVASFMVKKTSGHEAFSTIKNHIYPISKVGNYKLEYGDRITRGAPAIIVLHAKKDAEAHTENAIIYATYMMLTAHALGLGAMMNSIVAAAINRVKSVREIFNIPEDHDAVVTLILGHSKYKYKRTVVRKEHQVQWVS